MNQPAIIVVPVDVPEGVNLILGQAHFTKTVEDLYEVVGSSPYLRFGLAFCEASGPRLVRRERPSNARVGEIYDVEAARS
jgi:adenosine/AMP kinase